MQLLNESVIWNKLNVKVLLIIMQRVLETGMFQDGFLAITKQKILNF